MGLASKLKSSTAPMVPPSTSPLQPQQPYAPPQQPPSTTPPYQAYASLQQQTQAYPPAYPAYQSAYPPSPPQQSYQPPQTHQAYTSPPQQVSSGVLAQKLQSIISHNKLEAFYDSTKFNTVLQKVQNIDFDSIAREWNIPKEIAYDLASLALYDIVFFCDDSGSMMFEEGGERVDDLKAIISKVAPIATLFDDDGILVRFINSNVNGDGIRNAAETESLIQQIRFSGGTPLATQLEAKVIKPFVLNQATANAMPKPVLVIAITDGEPSDGRYKMRDVISSTKQKLARTKYGPGAFALQVAQVGKDQRAQKYLEELDNDASVGRMIDCTSYFELESEEFRKKGVDLTPELWLTKVCVGAIDPTYDALDE